MAHHERCQDESDKITDCSLAFAGPVSAVWIGSSIRAAPIGIQTNGRQGEQDEFNNSACRGRRYRAGSNGASNRGST